MSTDELDLHHASEDDRKSQDDDIDKIDAVKSESYFGSDSSLDLSVDEDSDESDAEMGGQNRVNIDFDNIEDVTNILSQIQLVWPENLPSYDKDVHRNHPRNLGYPPSYYECTDKEKAALWHAENFRQQFAYLYPTRRPLYLAPKNDCGCQKLFPTYINPTVLGYPEFYEYDSIMDFLKDYLSPDFIDPPDVVPAVIRSPITNLKIRCSNIFEYSLVAASFLIGAGYDAYVVDGYAVKAVTTGNSMGNYVEEDVHSSEDEETRIVRRATALAFDKAAPDASQNDFNMDIFREEDIIPPVSPSKYRTQSKPEKTSSYLAAMQKRVDDKAADDKLLADAEAIKEAQRHERPPTNDVYEGYRVHAWILILPGKRGILKPFFLEPFSGSRREVDDSRFLGIEAVFNSTNYYVNHQDCQGEGVEKLSFNLKDKTKWSKFLYEPPPKKRGNPTGNDSFQEAEEDDTPEKIEMFLDMPTSWVTELEITQEEYDLKYPDGRKVSNKIANYDDAILEIASPFVNLDGTIKKVIKFTGPSRKPKDIQYIEEWFQHRKDKLIRRKWVRDGRMMHEYFGKGRRDALKEHHHVASKNNPSEPRTLVYYSKYHRQHVVSREIIPRGMIEHFENRDDKMYYRYIEFGKILCYTIPPQEIKESGVKTLMDLLTTDGVEGSKTRARRKTLKIIEKYHRNPDKDYRDDIAEKHMLLDDLFIRVVFHYGEGCITRNSMEYFKIYEDDDFNIKNSLEFRADPYSAPMDEYTKFNLLKQVLLDETRSDAMVAEADDEVYSTVRQRVQEDWRHDLEPDDFSESKSRKFVKQKQLITEFGYDPDISGIDFTTPFIEKYGLPKDKKEEILMKKRIVYRMKNRILKQAQSMESAFNHESTRLKSKLDWYESFKNQMNPTEEEIFRNFYKEALFKMHMIKQRMIRHIEMAPSAYYTLIYKILQHPLLNNFTNNRVVPPQPEPDATELDNLLKLKEAERLLDCCQFYHYKFKPGVPKEFPKDFDLTAKSQNKIHL